LTIVFAATHVSCGGEAPLPAAHALAAPAPVGAAVAAPAATALPAVALRDLQDRPIQLEVATAGKVALVSFWATWCDACVAEVDALNRLEDHARKGGGMVIGVAVGETREKAAAFAHERGLRYAQLVDERLTLADALGQKRLPATLVLDRDGRVVFVGGALDARALAVFRDTMATPPARAR
jgi:peroxiredoxin